MIKLTSQSPKVSIGIPVYNGENFLEFAIKSLLEQSFQNFEIVISDNASTDRTQEICQYFQSQDRRVRYYRSSTNLGAAANYKKVFNLSKGTFFKWMAHDDICSLNYLEDCVQVLESDPSTVICFPKVLLIDKDNNPYPSIEENVYLDPKGKIIKTNQLRDFTSNSPSNRYSEVLFKTTECYEFFGLSRRNIIEQTSQHDAYYGSDKVLLSELSLMGKLQEVPSAICYFRIHDKQSQAIKSSAEKAAWVSPELSYGVFMLRVKCVQGYLRSIFAYRISPLERVKCLGILVAYLSNVNKWRSLLKQALRQKGLFRNKKNNTDKIIDIDKTIKDLI